jgi:hypothetical protein
VAGVVVSVCRPEVSVGVVGIVGLTGVLALGAGLVLAVCFGVALGVRLVVGLVVRTWASTEGAFVGSLGRHGLRDGADLHHTLHPYGLDHANHSRDLRDHSPARRVMVEARAGRVGLARQALTVMSRPQLGLERRQREQQQLEAQGPGDAAAEPS